MHRADLLFLLLITALTLLATAPVDNGPAGRWTELAVSNERVLMTADGP